MLFSQFVPHGVKTSKQIRKLKRDRRRWIYADADADDILNKSEFQDYLFPTNSLGQVHLLILLL